jgi:prevent-host-death family protein
LKTDSKKEVQKSEKKGSKIDFKVLRMMELRSSPGEVLDRVARDGEVFVVERSGQPLACLVPVSFLLPDISPDRIARELDKLREKNESYKLTITDEKELEINLLETAAGEKVVLSIVLPHGYPSSAPRIRVSPLPPDTPHLWRDGSLSIFGATAAWNNKGHDVLHTLGLARRWIKQYAIWRKSDKWPEGLDGK